MALFETLTDDFDNGVIGAQWSVSSSGVTVSESGGHLNFAMTSGTYGAGQIASVSSYDLTGSYVKLNLRTVASAYSGGAYLQLAVGDGPDLIYILVFADRLEMVAIIDGVTLVESTYDYFDIRINKWLRIREASGTLWFESSTDGGYWFPVYTASTTGVSMSTSMRVFVQGGTGNPSTVTANQVIDNFNISDYFTPIIDFSGGSTLTATPHVTYNPDVIIEGDSTLSALATSLVDQSKIEKTYMYKVYDTDDSFLGIWDDVISDLTYDQEINSAGSSIQVDLARNSDSRVTELENITTTSGEALTTQDSNNLIVGVETTNSVGPGSNVDVNYRVEVWVFYGEITELITTSGENITTQDGEDIMVNFGAVNGLRKFHGYITRYVSRYGGNETVQVSIASFGIELDNYVLESGSNTTVTYSSQDPSNIVKDALDKFTAAGGLVDYAGSSVETTGTSVTYTFRLNTYLEVLRKAIELAPYDWFWWVGLGDDTVYYQDRPTTASQTFVLGKHIQELNLEYSIEEITNVVYFTGGEISAETNLFKKYTDSTSITNYRQGLQRITDHRVTLDASADLIAEAEMERNSTPRYRTSITILDKVYDIESLTLGQLVAFRNFGNYIDALTLQIVGLRYEPDRVTLQLDTLLPSVNKRVADLRRNLIELDNEQTPAAPS